ncbi:hypothetical protein JJL45_03345 [Tamlana sp. s12]|uniref:hypothetical protein n=1 Tax=Tamlana sp. s12 TaxID=1630406 RepID=UPI000801EDE0|nr:hypothetical protein [Tamlana sp. s12]OBQ54936.1 hypothetical protein VQ01_09320 [Tamlana sp. s12]QQY83043.1 hypothetical protein JJL45_03345 [Tamlana sp. s12]
MLVFKIENIVKIALGITIMFLGFSSLNAFTTGSISVSIFLICGLCLVGAISVLKFKTPPFAKDFATLLGLYILLSSILNVNAVKLTSVIYSFLFLIIYIYISYYSKQYLVVQDVIRIYKLIFFGFFIVLVISQFIVLLGWEVLERPKGYFQSTGQLGIQFNHVKGKYRFHSLSTEPSYAALIVIICFSILWELIKEKKKFVLLGILMLYMLISFKSAIGFIALFIWCISLVSWTKKHFFIIGFLVLIGLLLFLFTNIGGQSIQRVREVVFLLFSFSGNFFEKLNLIDSSAYARIGPTYTYLKEMDLINYKVYFGHGAGESVPYFSKIVYPESWNSNMVFKPPFIPGFFYDYGIVGTLLVVVFIWNHIKKRSVFFKVVFLLILLNSNFNTQLFWFGLIAIMLCNYFEDNNSGLETVR